MLASWIVGAYYFMICLNNFCRIDVARPNKKQSVKASLAPLIQKIETTLTDLSVSFLSIAQALLSIAQFSCQSHVRAAVCVCGCTLLFHAHGPLNITLRFLIWPSDI